MTDADILDMDIDELAEYMNNGKRKQVTNMPRVSTNIGRSLNESSGV